MPTPDPNPLDNYVARLKAAGFTMPKSSVQARWQTKQALGDLGGATNNRQIISDMNRSRTANRITGSNLQIALPKFREPGMSLIDKGIPINVTDPEELKVIRSWCRLWYCTHNLVPLLIDIYAKFPLVGLEFTSKDPLIAKFYEDMFLDRLNYQEFLPDVMGREYFTVGEVTTLAHFNEQLGVWSSEEVLNPDMLMVSKSIFTDRERVQLLVKDLVEGLRTGPNGTVDPDETPSQRMERTFQYQTLTKYYPEIVEAAAQDDGLDLSDALISRIVNKSDPFQLRGTPHLLRSFGTLMTEESLLSAQNAVADRLMSPMILAKVGSPDLGDGLPWIPDPAELDDVREDMQNALAADFRLIVGNFGLEIENVFGRESVPRFLDDFQMIELKLLQSWGIGEALVSGGQGGSYASSALNREFVTQMMSTFQNQVKRHIIKRAEVIAEAQEHYDYELKGGIRRPLYREIVRENEETGEEEIVRVPKLLLPDISFRTLNLRDEATERTFIQAIKAGGVPVSDRMLSVNIEMDWDQELEKTAEETVKKQLAQAQAMAKVQRLCDEQKLPYPPELSQFLTATLQIRQQLAATQVAEGQATMAEAQAKQMSPAGQMGLLPGTTAMQPATQPQQQGGGGKGPQQGAPGQAGSPTGKPAPQQGPGGQGGSGGGGKGGQEGQQKAPTGQSAGSPGLAQPGMGGPKAKPQFPGTPASSAPSSLAPGVPGVVPPKPPKPKAPLEVPRNRQRPPESDSMRGNQPKAAKRSGKKNDSIRRLSKFETGPSSYGRADLAGEQDAIRAVHRLEAIAKHQPIVKVADLVNDPDFYTATNTQPYQAQIQADFPEIGAGRAKESAKLLNDALAQYEWIYGSTPEW